jgi:uncharacterized membrane protein
MTSHLRDLLDAALAAASLPNLHPAIVHFPVALLATAFGFDLACLLFRRQVWLDRAAPALYALGTLGAGIAYLTGEAAAEAMTDIPGVAQVAIAEHQRFALWTLIAFSGVSLLRLLLSWLDRKDKRLAVGFFRLLVLAAALGAQSLLFLAAENGWGLVFKHQLGEGQVERRAVDTENLEP